MNCANHADASAVAYCRTCGKALCANCTRPVKGVIYCEDCLGARMQTTVAPASVGLVSGTAPMPTAPPSPPPIPSASSGPNPALAGILGAIPFGVGAVYNGQYAKGLAHLIIFFLLVAGANASGRGSDTLNTLCGFGIAAFVIYQIVDAVRSAQAIRAGQPAPDPFGLSQAFSTGEKVDTSKIPTGAIVLIVLGALFLLSTTGLLELSFSRLWPIAIIILGAWLFATRWGLIGAPPGCTCERCRSRLLMGPAVLVTIGVVGLIRSFREISLFAYIGAALLVIGAVRLFQGGASTAGHRELPPPGPGAPPVAVPHPPSTAPTEGNRG